MLRNLRRTGDAGLVTKAMPSSVSNDDVGVGEGIAFWRATFVAVAKDVSMEEGEPASSRKCSEELCSEELRSEELCSEELCSEELSSKELSSKELSSKELFSKELSSKECSEERGPEMEEG